MPDSDREELLSRLLKKHGAAVQRWLSVPADLRSLVSAEDVMQEAYVDAFLAIDRMPADDEEFRSWLGRLATNNLRDTIRLGRTLKRGGAGNRVGGNSAVELQEGHMSSPSRAPRRAERSDLLRRTAASLPDPYGSAAVAMLEGEAVEDIARHLGKSMGTTYVVMGRARKLLGQALWRWRSEVLSDRG